jgi:hypothetical protein
LGREEGRVGKRDETERMEEKKRRLVNIMHIVI